VSPFKRSPRLRWRAEVSSLLLSGSSEGRLLYCSHHKPTPLLVLYSSIKPACCIVKGKQQVCFTCTCFPSCWLCNARSNVLAPKQQGADGSRLVLTCRRWCNHETMYVVQVVQATSRFSTSASSKRHQARQRSLSTDALNSGRDGSSHGVIYMQPSCETSRVSVDV
jgi:hypothetical protein